MIFSLPLLSLIYLFTNTANAYHIPRLLPKPTISGASISSTAGSTYLLPRSTGDESISTNLIVVIVGGGFLLSLVLSVFGIYKTLCSSSRRGSSRYVPTHAELISCWDRFGNSPWNRNGNVRVIGGQLVNLGPPRLGCEVGLEELREFWRLSGHSVGNDDSLVPDH
jgi:hypothetical protein